MTAQLLEADQLRVDRNGVPVIDGLNLSTTGQRVGIVGASRTLFEAASALVLPTRGTIRVNGVSAEDAVRLGNVASVPLDPPMPPRWTIVEYVAWSAALAGQPRAIARRAADDALAIMRLDVYARAPLGNAAPNVRRGAAIAAALATGARLVLLEDPLASFDDAMARSFAEVVVAALRDRAWMLFTPRARLSSPLVQALDEAIVVSGASCDARGLPAALAAEGRRYSLDVHGDVGALAHLLAEAGARVDSSEQGAPTGRLVVDLASDHTTRDLLAFAERAGAVLVEMRPIARAFA